MPTADTPIEFLKGIGPERAKLLKEVLAISTVQDFLDYYPLRYVDKSRIIGSHQLCDFVGYEILLRGKIFDVREIGEGRSKRLTAKFRDANGTAELVWFQYSKWLKEQLPVETNVLLFGKVNEFNQQYSIAHPEIELYSDAKVDARLTPVYPTSEKLTKRGISQKFFRNIIANLFLEVDKLVEENLPAALMQSLKLIARPTAYFNVHFPLNSKAAEAADRRLKFEEAFFFQLSYGLKKDYHNKSAYTNPFPIVGDYFNQFYQDYLPFQLTGAQKRVIKEIRHDLRRPIQMNRLLQGDVGSGKTVVALLTALISWDNGYQTCIMAPTEILAQQHFQSLAALLKDTDVQIELLTGSTKTKKRKELHESLEDGKTAILVGTHAVLENPVKFKNLGLAVIDEQHRFGVAQRAKLWAKNKLPPHILVMTATPIPRTLAMSFYSDLDVSVIDELPANRKQIITAHRREKDRLSVYNFAKDEILKGRQVYFVYPLIQESETLDYRNLMDGFEHISEFFKDFNITMVHGQLSADQKEENMQYFASGAAQIMVATTVIEVGVNVPNASVMIIESAERFGLSQLHQLRGRVGRGAEQSYCILMTGDKLSAESRKRLKTMVETTDGFKISEVDMELRGPGDILGTQQSGVVDFKKLNLVSDGKIVQAAKNAVEKLLKIDPALNLPEHQAMRKFYLQHYRKRHEWGKIS